MRLLHLVHFQDPLRLHLGCTMVKWQEFIQFMNHENNLQVYFKVKYLFAYWYIFTMPNMDF